MSTALYGCVSRHYLTLRQTAWYIRHSKENDVSKFDYRDPGTHPKYCYGISDDGAEPDAPNNSDQEPDNPAPTYTCWNCQDVVQYGTVHACNTIEPDYPVCRFCGQPLGTDPTDYYCDVLCEQ